MTSRRTGRPDRLAVDVYLMPAIVGGGFGDIDEVLVAGEYLAAAGAPLFLFRRDGRPPPRGVDGPWRWPPAATIATPARRHRHALTVTPCFGVSAAPGRPEPLGRPGPWAEEAAAIERAYGPGGTLHLSLEEFARTYGAARENRERYREGGVPRAAVGRRLRGVKGPREVARWRSEYRKHRSLDRADVLHLLATFRRSPPFGREYPEIVQVGPLWPFPRPTGSRSRRRPAAPLRVVWYASPSSSARIAPQLADGLARSRVPIELIVRSSRPVFSEPPEGVRLRELPALSPDAWEQLWGDADCRIATGSRTLLDAIDRGGPFLYFNGVTGRGRSARRHRPEKVAALLDAWEAMGVPRRLRADVDAFSRGHRVGEIARRAVSDPSWWRGVPSVRRFRAGTPPDAGTVLGRIVRAWAAFDGPASEMVRRFRTRPE